LFSIFYGTENDVSECEIGCLLNQKMTCKSRFFGRKDALRPLFCYLLFFVLSLIKEMALISDHHMVGMISQDYQIYLGF
jgi:hypothetical protein